MKVSRYLSPHLPRTMIESPDHAQHDGALGLAGDPLYSKKGCFKFRTPLLVSKRPHPADVPVCCHANPPKKSCGCQAATFSILRSLHHSGRLYIADNVAHALNSAANMDGSVETSMKVDTSMLLRAFANDVVDECILVYDNHFCCCKDKNSCVFAKQ